ncbi:MAG: hypothetical protein ACR2M0_08625 [Chloroflexia bacterium]
MLTLVAAGIAFGVLVGLIAWRANDAAYNSYDTLVNKGSVSVDAALRARAAALDHMGQAATYLATTGAPQQAAEAAAAQSWNGFNEEARKSWNNRTDQTQGEFNVFAAADAAASLYIQQIGAMFSYSKSNPPQIPNARAAFLQARDTLNFRLVPALTGLEEIKVEDMAATDRGAAAQITGWRNALLGVTVLLGLALLAALGLVLRMHYRWSWTIGSALLLTILVGGWMQLQLSQASRDTSVMVHDAYDTVSGVQDLTTLLAQERALESIAIFDSENAAKPGGSFEQYAQYAFLVDQTLCGPAQCALSDTTFLSAPSSDAIADDVKKAALDEQNRLGLPRVPLVANVHFPNEAAQFDQLRQDYQAWQSVHNNQLAAQVTAGQKDAAAATSTGPAAAAYATVIQDAANVGGTARTEFDRIARRWTSVQGGSGLPISLINEALALLFPFAGLLAALGLWRRRSELFA